MIIPMLPNLGRITVAMLALVVVVACGGIAPTARPAVLSAVGGDVIAVDAKDARAACMLLTREAQQAAISQMNRLVGSGEFIGLHRARDCVEAFRDVHPGRMRGRRTTADPARSRGWTGPEWW